jgi:DNA-binding CsgD family transcriptional regulator
MPSSDKRRPVGASGKKKKKGPVASDYMDEKEVIGRTVAGLKGTHAADRETALRMGMNPDTIRMDRRGDIMGLGARARESAAQRLMSAQRTWLASPPDESAKRLDQVRSAGRGLREADRAQSLMRRNRRKARGG